MKIVVIGAGHAGLQAAKVLAQNGYDVTVFEKQQRCTLGYDWCDDVEPTVFDQLSISLPQGSCKPDALSFVAPFSSKPLFVYSQEDSREWHIDRRLFLQQLTKVAENAGCKVQFDCLVESLIIKNQQVQGVVCNGKKILCDLVIDSSGMCSDFKSQLPKSYGITPCLKDDEYFSVYRAFYNMAENASIPQKHRKKLYLKHLGEKGISWCILENNNMVNVLIGRVGKINHQTVENALAHLRSDNSIIGDKILRGGQYATIPIRYPLTKMVGDGYVAVGDCAFMTVPLIGSGIANSLRAGQILAEKIVLNKSVSTSTLWQYQTEYYEKIGAQHFMIDLLKRALLDAHSQDIKYIFECGVLTDDDMLAISNGEGLKLGIADVVNKLSKLSKKQKFVKNLVLAAVKGLLAQKCAKSIPKTYDEKAIQAWQKRLERYF